MARSLAELLRVSKAACRLRFLTHAREGVVVGNALRQLNEVNQLRDSGIFAAAIAVASAQDQAGSSSQSIHQLQHDYQGCAEKLVRAASISVEPQMFTNTIKVLSHALSVQAQVGLQTIVDKITEVDSSIQAHAARLEAMTQAAMDEFDARDLAVRIGKLWGRESSVDACLRADGALMGWVIESATV